VAFAVRYPERVSRLVLYGGFARGAYRRAKNDLELQKAKALATLIRTGWGEETPVFRQLFSSMVMPDATQEQLQKFAERQRKTTTAECAYRYFETTRNLDVSELLAKVTVPTLVCTSATTRCNRSRRVASSPPEFTARASWHCREKITSR
jgi:pimeloyl-ACP methyl ester carboxylesterase